MNDNTIDTDKSRLRSQLKLARANLSETERQVFSRHIAEQLLALPEVIDAHSFFIYISTDTEVDTHGILQLLLTQGRIITVPVITREKTMIARRLTDWGELRPGQLGILTLPQGEAYDGPIDIVVTPGLGFTEQGLRLGYGAGYYDKWFAAHPVKHKTALAFEAQIVSFLPINPYDIPVDRIVTEQRLVTCKIA